MVFPSKKQKGFRILCTRNHAAYRDQRTQNRQSEHNSYADFHAPDFPTANGPRQNPESRRYGVELATTESPTNDFNAAEYLKVFYFIGVPDGI